MTASINFADIRYCYCFYFMTRSELQKPYNLFSVLNFLGKLVFKGYTVTEKEVCVIGGELLGLGRGRFAFCKLTGAEVGKGFLPE